MPEDSFLQVGYTAMRVDQPVLEGIIGDGIDREVTPGRRLSFREVRVRRDGEAAVAGTGLGFAAGQAEIVFGAVDAQLEHAEAAPDEIGRPERRKRAAHRLVIQPVDLDVEILRGESQQPVAHAATGQPRPPAR